MSHVTAVWPQYKSVDSIPHMNLAVPHVSDDSVDRVLQRMRDVELTNHPLSDITKEIQLVHWMGAVSTNGEILAAYTYRQLLSQCQKITTEVARYFEGALRNEAEKSI